MTSNEPTPIFDLSLRPNSRFKARLVAFIRELAEAELPGKDRQASREHAERRASAQNALAGYINAIPVEDSRLFLLAEVARSLPQMRAWRTSGEPFAPTVTQSRILFALGTSSVAVVDPDATFSELVTAGVADMAALYMVRHRESENAREAAEERAREAEAKVAPLAQVEGELTAERAKSERLQAAVDRLQARASELEGFVGAENGPKPRRVHVGGGSENVGVYRSFSEGVPILEVGYPDAEGKQRWRRLGPDASIEDARRERSRLAGQPHDPEHNSDPTDEEIIAAEAASQGDGDTKTTNPEPVAAGKEG